MHATVSKRRSSFKPSSIHRNGNSPLDPSWTLSFRETVSKELEVRESLESSEVPIVSGAEMLCLEREKLNEASQVTSVDDTNSPLRKRKRIASPHLSLSLFRRPENTVRLTKCDLSRKLEVEYDCQGKDCRVLGHGAFSTVRSAIRRHDGMKVAIKSISKHDALKARRLRISGRTYVEEWEILKQLSENQHVVSLLDIFETSYEIQLVLEYCPGGELFDAIQRKQSTTLTKHQYKEEDASLITRQLLHALQDIHKRGIAHKDIKPENILLFSTEASCSIHVKLCDFGMARVICQDSDDNLSCDGDSSPATPSRTQSFQLFASDYYTAPELQLGCGLYDTAVDMFSLGVTVYILLCGFPPVFEGDDSACVTFPLLYWKNISEEAKDFVRSLLAFEPAYRISAERAMKHPWIRKGDGCSLTKSGLTTGDMRMALLKRRLYQCLKHPKTSSSRDKDKYRQYRKRPRRARVIRVSLAELCATGVTAAPSVEAIASPSP